MISSVIASVISLAKMFYKEAVPLHTPIITVSSCQHHVLRLDTWSVLVIYPFWLRFNTSLLLTADFPAGSDRKESACNAGDPGSIPGLGRSPGEENGNPLQHSYLENPMDRLAWWAIVPGVTESWSQLRD